MNRPITRWLICKATNTSPPCGTLKTNKIAQTRRPCRPLIVSWSRLLRCCLRTGKIKAPGRKFSRRKLHETDCSVEISACLSRTRLEALGIAGFWLNYSGRVGYLPSSSGCPIRKTSFFASAPCEPSHVEGISRTESETPHKLCDRITRLTAIKNIHHDYVLE